MVVVFSDRLYKKTMAKAFDNNDLPSGNSQQFVLKEDDRLKQEEDYRQGK